MCVPRPKLFIAVANHRYYCNVRWHLFCTTVHATYFILRCEQCAANAAYEWCYKLTRRRSMLFCHWAMRAHTHTHIHTLSPIDDGATATAHANAQFNHKCNNKWGHYVRFEFLCHGLGHKSWAQHQSNDIQKLNEEIHECCKAVLAAAAAAAATAAAVLVLVFCSHN